MSLSHTNARVLLVENIHPRAADRLREAGLLEVERTEGAVSPEELLAKARGVELLGIRSRTQVDRAILEAAENLEALGCFCIGTNQVDLETAERRGIPVFNAPFANARSVAELTIAAAIFLMRGMPAKMAAMHRGEWRKTAKGAYEVRKKKLGIVGYGNIGSQLSVIASALGMHVYYYDVEPKLAHGNARAMPSLEALLEIADVVTLHVPETPQTHRMIDAAAIAKMKPGAVLINYARGSLVDLDALSVALKSGHLAGAAIDVFPTEPKSASDVFEGVLRGHDTTILSPHIGGSTQEAQEAIGEEVADKLAAYHFEGATVRAVNFPEIAPPRLMPGITRFAHVHENVPGVMRAIGEAVAQEGLNITSQLLGTTARVGYAVTDVEGAASPQLAAALQAISGTIRLRVLRGEARSAVAVSA